MALQSRPDTTIAPARACRVVTRVLPDTVVGAPWSAAHERSDEALHSVALPETVKAMRPKSDADRDKLATWRWRVQWPDGAVFVAQLSKADKKGLTGTNTKAGKRLRIETRILAADRTELACCLVAVPPERRFARVLWMGRGQACENAPVHPCVRGCRTYSTRDGCVTTARALLGAAAVIAPQLGISTIELFPADNGSGKLALYLQACALSVATPRDQDIMLRLESACSMVAQLCCPVAWVD
eukprot:3713795-Amphidinium_carterae.1